MERYKLGVVGAGLRGEILTRSFAASGRFDVVAVADPSATRRAVVSDRFGAVPYASTLEMVRAEALDVAIVATPDFAHLEPVQELAGAGLHLYIEKPLATT